LRFVATGTSTLTSVTAIEALTASDFLAGLPDDVETVVEPEVWSGP
jgi:hypothetical protein